VNLRAIVERRSSAARSARRGHAAALSFAPFGWWPMAILMPAALIWLWEGATPRRAAVLGFWFNAGTFSVGTYWLYIAIKQIGHAPLVLALFLMGGLVAIMGAYHALLGWAGREVPARARRHALAGGHSRRVAVHRVVAQLVPHGFGWLALGYAHTDNWLGGLAPVIGQYGLGLLTLLLAGGLVALLLRRPTYAHRRWRAVPRRLERGVRASRHRVDRALRPPDHRRRGAGRDSAG
jgi:apolipoprotein N-acyltransferase